MKNLLKKLISKKENPISRGVKAKDISATTNAIFDQYKKSFKDLARYDREGKISVN